MSFEPDLEQRRVLDHRAGPLLVSGPPGSGKSVLLRERFARLVEEGVDPQRVALFTLHRRAAREGREALLRRLRRSLPDLPVVTVHGYAFRVLGRWFERLGYAEPPQVLSAPEQYAFVREMLAEEDPGDWPRFRRLLGVRGFARELADLCLRAQERLLSPEDLGSAAAAAGRADYQEVARFYGRYLDAMEAAGTLDYAGLLSQAAGLLAGPDRPPEERFDHVLADDYQDATPATEAILRALGGDAQSVVMAADPAGHVFSFRGGTLEPLERIGEVFPSIERVSLPMSYRLDAGALEPLEHGDPPVPDRGPPPGIEARLFVHPGEEVEAVAHELLRARVDDNVPWDRMAVIVRRYGEYLTSLRHVLARHGIPFTVVAEETAVATEPVNRPVIDLLRYVWRAELREDVLEALLSSPLVGLEPSGLRGLRREARRRGLSLRGLVEGGGPVGNGPVEAVERFRGLVDGLRERPAPDRAFFWLWTTAPCFAELVGDGGPRRELDALAALGDVLGRFVERRPDATVEDYLETLEAAEFGPDPWVPPEERHPGAVRIVSAHRAHGQEYEVATVVGCLEGEFPSLGGREPMLDLSRLLTPRSAADRARARLAEERALFRLAVSRARRRTVLFASHSASSRNPRTPSRFVSRLGIPWVFPDAAHPHGAEAGASLRSMEASLRRRLADPSVTAPERLAALALLPAVGARPEEWWGGRDWTGPGRPVYPEDELIRTSYSRLSTLENCGLQYLYQVELGLDPESTHQMWLGSLVHRLIEQVQREELPRKEDAILAALDEAWERDRFPSRAVERQRLRDARTMIRNWLNGEGIAPARSEEWFEIPIDGALLRGRIDAIFVMGNGHTRVVDYKTGRHAPTQQEADRDLQLAAYYLAMQRAENLRDLGEPRLLELAFLLQSRQREAFRQVRVRPHAIDGYEERAEATIRDLLGKVRAEDFAPNPEADCTFCRFRSICPLWPEGAEVTT
jgi:superfamily I DNA/RNA helicase/RecB family exonuclease